MMSTFTVVVANEVPKFTLWPGWDKIRSDFLVCWKPCKVCCFRIWAVNTRGVSCSSSWFSHKNSLTLFWLFKVLDIPELNNFYTSFLGDVSFVSQLKSKASVTSSLKRRYWIQISSLRNKIVLYIALQGISNTHSQKGNRHICFSCRLEKCL